MAFEHLVLEKAICFGWRPEGPTGKCWYDLAQESITLGWRAVDVKAMSRDLSRGVDACCFNIAQGWFKDVVTGFGWHAAFVNDHMLWKLDMPDSPNTEALPQDAKDFFASKSFLKFSKRCGDFIDRADKMYRNVVWQHVQDGEFLDVAEEKLERIIFDIETARFMDNLRKGKYELA